MTLIGIRMQIHVNEKVGMGILSFDVYRPWSEYCFYPNKGETKQYCVHVGVTNVFKFLKIWLPQHWTQTNL